MVYEDRAKNQLEPHTRCKPSGGARQFVTPYGTEIVEFRALQQIMVFDIGGPHRELFEYQCQQSNYAHELMVGTMDKVDRSRLYVP